MPVQAVGSGRGRKCEPRPEQQAGLPQPDHQAGWEKREGDAVAEQGGGRERRREGPYQWTKGRHTCPTFQ